jgi:hypothetical protein
MVLQDLHDEEPHGQPPEVVPDGGHGGVVLSGTSP